MSDEDQARFDAMKRQGAWSTQGGTWGQKENSWPYPANPFDVTHPLKAVDLKNPWAAR